MTKKKAIKNTEKEAIDKSQFLVMKMADAQKMADILVEMPFKYQPQLAMMIKILKESQTLDKFEV